MGKVMMSGIVPKLAAPAKPITAISGGDLAVGNNVYLRENGVLAEYLIVNQGIPNNSSQYDSSCNGIWLLRKDVYENRPWNTNYGCDNYAGSSMHTYLNNNFLRYFDEDTQNAIVQAKIPYLSSVSASQDGLSTKIFLLSGYEIGWTRWDTSYSLPIDGACLTYFSSASDATRIAYLNETANSWWLRSINEDDTSKAHFVSTSGGCSDDSYNSSCGCRPALILPSTALFDQDTMEFIGVA